MSIADELLELQQNTTALGTARTDIRTALAGKGVSASDHNFADFAGDIGSISSGGVESKSKIINGSPIIAFGDGYSKSASNCHFMCCDTSGNNIIPNFNNSSWRVCVKFKATSVPSGSRFDFLTGNTGNAGKVPRIYLNYLGAIGGDYSSNGSSVTDYIPSYTISTNTVYYVVMSYSSGIWKNSFYDENGTLIITKTKSVSQHGTNTSDGFLFGGASGQSSQSFINGEIYPDECFVEIGGTLIWGQTNSKTQNMGLEAD